MIGDPSPSASAISLYFHIPFCTRKCDYCHFYVLPERENDKQVLLDAFRMHWELCLPLLSGKTISTIYFGGGTPFLFGPSRLASLLELIRQSVPFTNPEITLEANPEHITRSLMQDYAQAGINRVSIGIQSLDNELLHLLGRQHTADKAIQAIDLTYQAGIHNISIDLMYDLPKQTLSHWENTLTAACRLPITHLSLYNLTIEPHTLFFKKQETLRPLIPDEEVSLNMYEKALEHLEGAGLKSYEISAFAKGDFYSRHNVGYWTARPFLGFGPSAFSYWEGKRFRCIAHLKRYYQALQNGESPLDFEEKLDLTAHLRELLAIQLRLKEGVNLSTFQQRHGRLDEETLHVLEELTGKSFLVRKQDQIVLTKQGILFYDTVASELI